MGDSFKSGSGNLNFGDSDEEEADDDPEDAGEEVGDVVNDEADTQESQKTTSDEVDERQDIPGTQDTNRAPEEDTTTSGSRTRQTGGHQYPYFVRRSNVGDERDNRLEVFARDEVVSRESEFRSRLASKLGTDAVAKTDAREYALLAAFDNVEDVAELMKEDGYGELD